jgi:dTDP-4-dehydrorhamnose reductase
VTALATGARVLVSGAGGLLGGRLAALLAQPFAVVAGVRRAPAPDGLLQAALDLDDADALERLLDREQPAAVVHSAALSEPDRCEREPELAWHANVEASARLARVCGARGLALVLLSTDMVFDGREGGRAEDDAPAPLQVYGRTKLAAERAVLETHADAAVVRACLVAGRGHGARGSASESVAWALARGERPRLFVDQRRTPADASSLADLLTRILTRGGSGVYHCGSAEAVTRHALGRRVAAILDLDAGLIDSLRSDDLPQLAARPRDVSLTCDRARRELGWSAPALDAVIADGRPAPA